MAVGDTAYYKRGEDYLSQGDTGNDQGLISSGYQKFNNQDEYKQSLQDNISQYQDLVQNQLSKSGNTYQYKNGSNYQGADPNALISQYQSKLNDVNSGQGIHAQGYNNGDQVVNGNYTTKSAVDQENSYQQAVANGSMRVSQTVNGVNFYEPTNPNQGTASYSGPSPGQAGYQTGQTYGSAGLAGSNQASQNLGAQANPNTQGGVQSPYYQPTAHPSQIAPFNPKGDLSPGSSGQNVKDLQNWLISQGYKIPDGATGFYGDQTKSAVADWQNKSGVNTQGNNGYFGPVSRAYLAGNPGTGNTAGVSGNSFNPYGTVDPNASVNLGTAKQGSYSQDMIGAGTTTQGVMDQRQTMENQINQYLSQQAQAQAQLNQITTAKALGQTDIMSGNANFNLPLNPDGSPQRVGGADTDFQKGQDAFLSKTLDPRETIAQMNLNTAVNSLALYKQTPAYQNEQQARDTFYNLSQKWGDAPGGIQYDPSLSANQNLAKAQRQMLNSPAYQATLVMLGGFTDANGVFHTYVRKSPSVTTSILGGGGGSSLPSYSSGNLPTASNPNTQSGVYQGAENMSSTDSKAVVWPSTPTNTSVTAIKDYQTGKTGEARTDINTALGHAFDANLLFQKIDPTRYQGYNAAKNALDIFSGGSAVSAYAQAATQASNELSKVYGAGTGGERTNFTAFGAAYQSEAQHNEFIKTTTSLLSSKLGAMINQLQTSGAIVKSLDAVMSPQNQIKLAMLKFNLNGIVPGIGVSPSTQAMINSAVYYPKDKELSSGSKASAGVYLPNHNGGYDKLN